MPEDCLFCKIAARKIDADVIAETESVVAFRDINPVAPTHVLVVPRRHVASVRELARGHGEVLTSIVEVLNSIADDEGLEEGYRIVTNVGANAGQTVDHLHFHLIGGRQMTWPPG